MTKETYHTQSRVNNHWQGVFHLAVAILLCLCCTLPAHAENHTALWYETEAKNKIRNNDWEGAHNLLKKGLRDWPETTELNELMGVYYKQKKDWEKARYFLKIALRCDGSNYDARQHLSEVETITQNYSSAICYINEMLEVTPYLKTLWIRKIKLYERLKDRIEADRLVFRMVQIFPEDEDVRRMVAGRAEEQYARARKAGDKSNAIESLGAMIKAYPNSPEYYIMRSNLLYEDGRTEEAMVDIRRGMEQCRWDISLVRKAVGILTEQHRLLEARDIVMAAQKKNNSAGLTTLLNDIEENMAYDALSYDPYIQFSKLYGKTKSNDALIYLLNTSVVRGYYDDAAYYIAEAKKAMGSNNPDILHKEYNVYKRMGEKRRAMSVLARLVSVQPQNTDAVEELVDYYQEEVRTAMAANNFEDALVNLDFILHYSRDEEVTATATKKKVDCLIALSRDEAAFNMLDSMMQTNPGNVHQIILKAELLARRGMVESALGLLTGALLPLTPGEENYLKLANSFEEISLPHIKDLNERGAYPHAYQIATELLRLRPTSKEALLRAIQQQRVAGKKKEYRNTVMQAFNLYPQDVDVLKEFLRLRTEDGEYDATLASLRRELRDLPGDSTLVKLHSSTTDIVALNLIKERKAQEAIALLDTALNYDLMNRTLLYDKGLAYEQLHQWDSAHYYLRYYQPSMDERRDFISRLNSLKNKSFRNTINVEYLHTRFGDTYTRQGLATIGYSRTWKRNTLSTTLNYAGRDGLQGNTDRDNELGGGIGLQGVAQWTHQTRKRWSWTLGAGVSNKYFPRFLFLGRLDFDLKRDWTMDVHANYRNVSANEAVYKEEVMDNGETAQVFSHWDTQYRHLVSVGAGATKDLGEFALGGKADGLWMNKSLYFNTAFNAKYFPLNEKITNINVGFSVGTAPESIILNTGMPGSLSHINSMVSIGGARLLTPRLTVSLQGSWYTFYNQTNMSVGNTDNLERTTNVKYKNLFNIHGTISLRF